MCVLNPVFRFCIIMIVMCCAGSTLAAQEDQGATTVQPAAKPNNDQAKPAQTPDSAPPLLAEKLPLDIVSKGTDQNGTLLSYRLKEELMSSKLFSLTTSEKRKFVLQIRTQPEFPDRPNLASIYSVALVYQEDSTTLTYYLDLFQGQIYAENVTTEMQKILEWSYSTLKRYHYLLDE